MTNDEKVKLLIDAFPEIWDALEQYHNSEGHTSISKEIRKTLAQLIEFMQENIPPQEKELEKKLNT